MSSVRMISKNSRINKRLRKYRMDRILKEQSFNKNEGKSFPPLTMSYLVLQMFSAKKKVHVTDESVNPLAMLVSVNK
jgi:hypothetical protein